MAWTLTKHGEFYYSACHVEELRGIPSGEFVNGMRVWVTGLGEYQMDTSESSADDGSLYIKPVDVDPADPARWVLIDPWKTATGFIGYTPSSFAPMVHTHPWSAIVPGAWKMFYSDGTPSVQELSLATAGRFLMTAGASSAPFFEAAAKLTWDTTNIRLGVGKDAPDVTVDSLVTDDARLMSFPLHIGHKSSDTVAGKILGTGVGMKFLVSATNNGVPVAQALIGSKWINKTAGSYDSILGFATVGIGGTLDTRAWVGSNGLTLLNAAGKECVFDPSSVAADITYTLPADNGDPGEVLVTDGSGVLSWGAPTPAAHTHAFGDITSGLPATWAPSAHAITSHTAGNWKVFYSDGAAAVQELALGAQHKVLMSNAANAAPSFELLTNNNLAASGTANIAWNKLVASANKGYAVITDAGTGYLTTEQYLDVTRGGTGVGSLTDHGVLVGSGTGDITALAVGTANYLLMGVNAADPTWGLLTNDNVAASGSANIAWNKLAASTVNAALRTGAGGYPEVVPVNATASNKFLRQVSSGAPSFEALSASDIPALPYAPAWSGLTVGSILYASAATTVGEITAVAKGRFLVSNGAGVVPYYPAAADLVWDETNDRLGIGVASPAYPLDVDGVIANSGDMRCGGTLLTVGPAIEVGQLGTGYRTSYVDLTGDSSTYSDYGDRWIRWGGAVAHVNAATDLVHRGTGLFRVLNQEAADMAFLTTNTTRMTIRSSGEVGLNYATPTWDLEVRDLADSSYGLLFDAGGQRIAGAKGGTGNLGLYADGIAAATGGTIWISGSASANVSAILFHQDGAEVMRIDGGAVGHTPGYVGIGTSTPDYPLDVSGVIRCAPSLVLLATNSNEVSISADPASDACNYILPPNDGDDANLLATDGGGNLSWFDLFGGTNTWTAAQTIQASTTSETAVNALTLTAIDSNSAGGTGLGPRITFVAETATAGSNKTIGYLDAIWRDGTGATPEGQMILQLNQDGTLHNFATFATGSGNSYFIVNQLTANSPNYWVQQTNSVSRFFIETTGTAGALFDICACDAGGTKVGTPSLCIERSTGYVGLRTSTMTKTINLNGTLNWTNIGSTTAAGYYLRFVSSSSSTGQVGCASSSDIRLKQNVVSLRDEIDVLSKAKAMRGVYFNWADHPWLCDADQTIRQIGCIAQEVDPILPEVIIRPGKDPDDGFLGIDYPMMVPFLLECVNALRERIENLENGK
jgi:hypothetical protein